MQRKYRWDKKYLYLGITGFLVIICSIAFFWILTRWSGISGFISLVFKALSPLTYGFVFAYLMNKILLFFETHFSSKLAARWFPKNARRAQIAARVIGICITVLLILSFLSSILALILPKIYFSIQNLVIRMPEYVNIAAGWITTFLTDNPELESALVNIVGNLSDYFTNWIQTSVLPQANAIITSITNGVFSVIRELLYIVIGFIVSIYLLYHKETLAAQSKKTLYGLFKPHNANRVIRGFRFVDKTCGGFLAGKIIDSLIVGIICYIVLIILKTPYAELVSVMVCVTNIIPFFGPFIGAIPSAALILLEDPLKCLIFVIFIIILQQVDGNIIEPKILSSSTGMSGFWIMFSILFFGGFFGFWGMLLGVPVFALIYAAFRRINAEKLAARNLPFSTKEFKNILYIDPETNTPVLRNLMQAEGITKETEADANNENENH